MRTVSAYSMILGLLVLASQALAEPPAPYGNNWGKWGDDDQLGTLNYITPEKVAEASKEIESGKVFNLAIELTPNAPTWTGRKYQHYMAHSTPSLSKEGGIGFAGDVIIMHLQYSTQWDGLSHALYDGKAYNNHDAPSVSRNASGQLSIHNWADKVVSRGVLLDIARLKDVAHLEKGYVITPKDLDAASKAQNVSVSPGDIVLIRTGWMNVMQTWETPLRGNETMEYGEPGLGLEAAKWLKDKQVAAVASDTLALEAIPFSETGLKQINKKGAQALPVHVELLVNQGMPIGEIWDFEDLAEDSAQDGKYTMFLSAPPLKVVNGVGSVLSPIAIK